MRNVTQIAYSGSGEITVTFAGDVRFREKQSTMRADLPSGVDVSKIQKSIAEKLREAATTC
nr:MAG TPA: molybdopterin converting factor [Caudoviricetes sp.]